MKCISKKSGFTLAELMVVVAILGILVTISIAVFGNHSGESEKAVCDANKTALMQHMDMEEVNDLTLIQTATQKDLEAKLLSAEKAMESDWHCPTGGTYTLSFRDQYDPDSWYIYCSYHDGGEEVKKLVNVGIDEYSILQFIEALKNDIKVSNVDSTASWQGTMTDNVNRIRGILEDLNINPDSDMLASWRYENSQSLYMSSVAINKMKSGEKFPCLKYNIKEKIYSIWIATASEVKYSKIYVGGELRNDLEYNIIRINNTNTDELTKSNDFTDQKKSYSAIKAIYDKVLNLYNSSPEEFQNYTTKKIMDEAGISSK